MNPEPLTRVLSNLVFDNVGELLGQLPYVLLFITGRLRGNWRFHNQEILLFFLTPRRKHRNQRCSSSQRELGHNKSRGGRDAKKVDKNSLIVEGIQVSQNSERSFTGAKNL